MNRRISKNLNYLRQRDNRTKLWVAERISKSNSVVANYESGKVSPPLPVIQQYADLFGVHVGDLVGKDLWAGEAATAVDQPDARLQREKRLLHESLEEKEARIKASIAELEKQLRRYAGDPDKKAEIEMLLAILKKG